VLIDDPALPADARLAIAQKSCSAAARSNRPCAKTTNPKSAARLSRKQAAVDSLLRLARNVSLAEEERRTAAARMARLLLPATPTGDRSWSRAVADEYGFVISPKIASEYRDAKLLLEEIENSHGSIRPGNALQADKARARLSAIRRSLEPLAGIFVEDNVTDSGFGRDAPPEILAGGAHSQNVLRIWAGPPWAVGHLGPTSWGLEAERLLVGPPQCWGSFSRK
jgi:hypothetical protein